MLNKNNIAQWLLTILCSVMLITSAFTQETFYSILLAVTLGLAMSAIIVTDARYFIIPDIISLPMILLGILLSPLFPHNNAVTMTMLDSCLAALLGFILFYFMRVLYKLYRQREGLGFGDVKLAAVAGAWTGLEGVNLVILLSCISALGFTLILLLSGNRIKSSTPLPFGVFIAPSIWIIWIVQSMHLY